MIVITAGYDGITATGHARSAPPGEDLICAAVTALVQTTLYALEELTPGRAETSLQQGDAAAMIHHPSEDTALIVDVFCTGIAAMEQTYPEFVRMIDYRSPDGIKTGGNANQSNE